MEQKNCDKTVNLEFASTPCNQMAQIFFLEMASLKTKAVHFEILPTNKPYLIPSTQMSRA
jgi:hypothetical protein